MGSVSFILLLSMWVFTTEAVPYSPFDSLLPSNVGLAAVKCKIYIMGLLTKDTVNVNCSFPSPFHFFVVLLTRNARISLFYHMSVSD